MLVFRDKLLHAASLLEIRSRRNIASLLAGDYRSTFRGSGMQFKEFRTYEPGDDIRHMSWTVTARTGKPTVKVYEEERELNIVALVDASGSTAVGSTQRKIDMYAEITALLGLAAVRAGDPFSVVLFSDKVLAHLPAHRSTEHVRQAMSLVQNQPLAGEASDLRPALSYLRRALKPRSLILVVSDFLMPSFGLELRALATRHEVVLLHGFDVAEAGEGLSGVYRVWDPESGRFGLLDGGSRGARARLAEYQAKLVQELQDLGRNCGADYLPLRVEDDYLKSLVHFFHQRGARR
ncbi:DUF58 domain-containing protein [bacterium]|nr:DUF58 domain-containing protein [bacterium]